MRLFVGLALPVEIRHRISGLSGGLPAARWVRPDSLHVTLRFIGEADRSTAEDIDAALCGINCPCFPLSLSGVGTFGNGRKLRALWVGVEKNETLLRLQSKVENAVVRAGLPPESRKFTPHVSLARFKSSPGPRLQTYIEAHNAFSAGPIWVEGFILFRSHLNRDGATYEALCEYPLEAPVGA